MGKRAKWMISGAAILFATAFMSSGPSGSAHDTLSFGVSVAQAAEGAGKGEQALEKAGKKGKYAFILFYRENNEQTTNARTVLQSALKRVSRKSVTLEIDVADAAEKTVVDKYSAARSPLPLLMVIAPNGAIMSGIPASQLDENKIVDAVGSKGSEEALKALQQKKFVVLCVQGRKTSNNAEAMRGVEEFTGDPKYRANTVVVKVDPTDAAEAKFLSSMKVSTDSPIATTVLLAPPGSVVSTFQGETHSDKLAGAMQSAAAPKSGGCCGGGKSCGPSASGCATPTTKAATSSQATATTPPPSAKQNGADPATKQGK